MPGRRLRGFERSRRAAAFAAARYESRGPQRCRALSGRRERRVCRRQHATASAEGFARVARDNSSYYLLGYYSTNNRADGKARRNEIKVARADVRVVHRTSYLAPSAKADLLVPPKPGEGGKVSTTPTASSLDDQLQELANNPLPVSTMSLRVAAAPFLSREGRSSVSVIVEIPAGTLNRTDDVSRSDSRVRLSIGFYKKDGTSVGREDPTIEVSRVPGETSRFVSSIPVPPGVYRLWVGAVETSSRVSGSVMTDIEVPDFNRPSALAQRHHAIDWRAAARRSPLFCQ